jgi:TM2 domain-containing membrane protein YozV
MSSSPRNSSPSLRRSLTRSLSRSLGLSVGGSRTGSPVESSRGSGRGARPSLEEPRTLAVSYLLWAAGMVGVCGLQRFYNRRPLSGLLWLFTLGLCGIGQLADLLLIPDLVKQANQSGLLEEALSALAQAEGEEMALPLERQLLLLARRAGNQGFTLNDALVDLQLPRSIDSAMVRAEIERLLQADLLDVGNDERGRVVYREP